ncbi:MAG: 50S ribosomal protein L44e [Candidatus Woesearchaeota archaeon]
MKVPKQINRHCPYCNKHATHTVSEAKRRGRNKTRPMSWGSQSRLRKRGLNRGVGNQGRFSRPPVASRKMTGKKVTKKTDFRYKCTECNKQHIQAGGIRAKKVEIQ